MFEIAKKALSFIAGNMERRAPAFVALVLLVMLYPDRDLFFSSVYLGRVQFFLFPWPGVAIFFGILCCLLLLGPWPYRWPWLGLLAVWSLLRAASLILLQTPEWTFLTLTFFCAFLLNTQVRQHINLRFLVFFFVALNYFWFGIDKSGEFSAWVTGDFFFYALHTDFFRGHISEFVLTYMPDSALKLMTWMAWLAELAAPGILFSLWYFRVWNILLIGMHIVGLLVFSVFPVSFTMLFFHIWLFVFERNERLKKAGPVQS